MHGRVRGRLLASTAILRAAMAVPRAVTITWPLLIIELRSDENEWVGVRVGLSGWSYSSWKGNFYPVGLKERDFLSHVGSHFSTVEINGTFYSLQKPQSFATWSRQVPDDFVFAVKGGRYITHLKRLRNAETAVANFFASGVLTLGGKLGPLLWQLPPQLAFDAALIEGFLELLPRTVGEAVALAARRDPRVVPEINVGGSGKQVLRHAFEVRHSSFLVPEFIALLRTHNAALVFADSGSDWPYAEDLTADFAYVRLHGTPKLYRSQYEEGALRFWGDRIAKWSAGQQPSDAAVVGSVSPDGNPRDVFVYFDNDAEGHAPFDAMRLSALLTEAQNTG